MALTVHLSYPGQCEEAFNFYAQLLGGEVGLLRYRDTPVAQDVPADWGDKIVHATLSLNSGTLAGADVLPRDYRRPQGFSVLVDIDGLDTANRVFDALAKGGSVGMPLQKTFWSPAFGVVVDRFGVPWEVNGTSSDAVK
jgi:PhnB protein